MGGLASLVLQTNGWHWVLDETRAHKAGAVVRSRPSMCIYLSAIQLRMLRILVIAMDFSVISSTNGTISKANQSSDASCSHPALVQLATSLHLVNRCQPAMVLPDEWFDDLDLDSPC